MTVQMSVVFPEGVTMKMEERGSLEGVNDAIDKFQELLAVVAAELANGQGGGGPA